MHTVSETTDTTEKSRSTLTTDAENMARLVAECPKQAELLIAARKSWRMKVSNAAKVAATAELRTLMERFTAEGLDGMFMEELEHLVWTHERLAWGERKRLENLKCKLSRKRERGTLKAYESVVLEGLLV